MKTLALVMIVKNESRSLEECLSQVKNLVDEIYITDTGSTDDTVEIARKFGAHISHFEWENDFAAARNYALEQSNCDWNLVLDADEYFVSGNREQIQSFMEAGGKVGAIRIDSVYVEKNGENSYAHSFITRLIPKGIGYTGKIHEQVESSLPIAPLPLVFEHDGYLQEGKVPGNLKILLEELEETPTNPYVLFQISKTLWIMNEYEQAMSYFERFYKVVPVGAAYRAEGVIAYIYNLLEMKQYDKGFKVIKRETTALGNHADYHFACGVFYTQAILADTQKYINYLPYIEKSYLRCLEIGEVPEHQGVVGTGSFKAAYNLGVWFEVTGYLSKALEYYEKSLENGYQMAGDRIKALLERAGNNKN